jgi:hypothetical protein
MLSIIGVLLGGLLTSVVLALVHQLVAAVVVGVLTVVAVVVLVVLARRGIRRLSAAVHGHAGSDRSVGRRFTGRRVR